MSCNIGSIGFGGSRGRKDSFGKGKIYGGE